MSYHALCMVAKSTISTSYLIFILLYVVEGSLLFPFHSTPSHSVILLLGDRSSHRATNAHKTRERVRHFSPRIFITARSKIDSAHATNPPK